MFDSISDSPKVTVSYSANPWLKWRKSTGTRSFEAFSLSSFFPKFPVTQQRLPKDVPLNNSPMALLFFFRCQDPHTSCGKVGWSTTGNSGNWRSQLCLMWEIFTDPWAMDFGSVRDDFQCVALSCSLPITKFMVDFEGSPPQKTVANRWWFVTHLFLTPIA